MIDNEREITIGSDSIHATHHLAAGDKFVVVAPPLFEECVRLRKVLVNLSRYLSSEGYDVVRFDYYGTGYSPGRYAELTLQRAQQNLADAIEYCKSQGASGVQAIGVRFGGYVALRAIGDDSVSRLVVWEPVVDTAAYVKEVLRADVATQMLIYGKPRQDRDSLVKTIQADGHVQVEGYCIGRDLYDEFAEGPAITAESLAPVAKKSSFIYWQSRREHKRWSSAGIRSHWVDGVRFAFNHIRHLEPRSEALYRQTLEELQLDG